MHSPTLYAAYEALHAAVTAARAAGVYDVDADSAFDVKYKLDVEGAILNVFFAEGDMRIFNFDIGTVARNLVEAV